jgi:hypothetical protein
MSNEIDRIRGIGVVLSSRLEKAGYKSIEQLANTKPTELAFVKGIGIKSANKIIANAKHLMLLEKGLTIVLDKIKENFVQHCPKCGGDMKEKFIILSPEQRIAAFQCLLCKFYLPR